jgi:hypothetical protein
MASNYNKEKDEKIKKTFIEQILDKNKIELIEFENKYKLEIQKAIDIIKNEIQIAILNKKTFITIKLINVYPIKNILFFEKELFKTEKDKALFRSVILNYYYGKVDIKYVEDYE